MTLSATEFLRRFSQHLLPRGFVRIRQYGFLATRHRTANWRLFANYSRSPRSLRRRAQRPLPRRPVGIAQGAKPSCRSVPTSPLANSLIDASSSTVRSLPTKLARRRATARRRVRVPLPRKPASNYDSGQSTKASASARRLAAVLPQASPSGQHALPAVPK